ncbi:hypothetical protein SAMN05216553_11781 [Lentzea fradiae]|uniref:Uncharacterized protein n=1 Tax=Lentzea fradiae TaxID=200378 RepID=A0A1G8AA51_9PSEU|nr:hypothetical protein [Lentzea fradiae]SDH17905.1 hypothetical protein SAMN05216553_11781 [Lentzea fradiae]
MRALVLGGTGLISRAAALALGYRPVGDYASTVREALRNQL